MLKRHPSGQLEEESKLALHQLVNSANHQDVSYSRDNFGIDGEVRLVHGVEHTGKGFKYQLKAGPNYISSENQEVVRLKVERKYVHQWHKMISTEFSSDVMRLYDQPDPTERYSRAGIGLAGQIRTTGDPDVHLAGFDAPVNKYRTLKKRGCSRNFTSVKICRRP